MVRLGATGQALASERVAATSQWLTLAQANAAIRKSPVGLAYCVNASGGDGYCFQWTSVRLHVTSGTINPLGESRLFGKTRRWRRFMVNATCGSDALSGTQMHSRFIWDFNLQQYSGETTDPTNPNNVGVAYLGC
jgi:hypothetical protein